MQRPSLEALLYRRGRTPLLRRDGRRRNVYNKRIAPWDLRNSNLARKVWTDGTNGHRGPQGEQDCRVLLYKDRQKGAGFGKLAPVSMHLNNVGSLWLRRYAVFVARSEERRVGKECRYSWS